MKAHKKIIITVALALALGLAGAAFAVCRINGAIPDVDIHTHDAGDIEYANEEAYFGCTNIPYEWDECRTDPACPWGKVADDVDILWEATAGSFKDGDNEGSWVIWIAPASAGNVTLTATADDDARYANDTAKDDSVTIEVVECDDSVNYDVGERCETCEWIEADRFFPYCGTPKYVEINFDYFVGCGSFPSVDKIILIQTTPTTWHVGLNDGVFCTWDVYWGDPGDHNSALYLEAPGCPAFTDYHKPVCYDGNDPEIGKFTNHVPCPSGCPCANACGHSGEAVVAWRLGIGHTEYINQFPAWQESVFYDDAPPFWSDRVRHSSKLYICIEDHTSSSSNEPGVGQDWETYWGELPS